MRKNIILQAIFAALLFSACGILAEGRSYTRVNEYSSLPAGQFKLEYSLTSVVMDKYSMENSRWDNWLELSYGLSESTGISSLQKFSQSTGAVTKFSYDGFNVRFKHQISKKDTLFVDMLFYLGYARAPDLSKTDIIEWREVFSKDIGRLNIVYNMSFEYEPKNNWRFEHNYAFGMSYDLEFMRIGLESHGNYSRKEYYLGPSVSIITKDLCFTFSPEWGLVSAGNQMQIMAILGLPFGK